MALKQATEWYRGVKRAQSHSHATGHARTTKTASTRGKHRKKVQEKDTKREIHTKNDTRHKVQRYRKITQKGGVMDTQN